MDKIRCAEIAAKFETRTAFTKGAPWAYTIARKAGWLDDICPPKQTGKLPKPTKEACATAAKKFPTRKAFAVGAWYHYDHARRAGWLDDICPRKASQRWTADELKNPELLRDNKSALHAARVRGFVPVKKRLSLSALVHRASKYENALDLFYGNREVFLKVAAAGKLPDIFKLAAAGSETVLYLWRSRVGVKVGISTVSNWGKRISWVAAQVKATPRVLFVGVVPVPEKVERGILAKFDKVDFGLHTFDGYSEFIVADEIELQRLLGLLRRRATLVLA